MAIIDLVRWAPQGLNNIYAWRFPETNLSTYTQLIVQESQEAVLFSKGQIIGKFGPGKHTLNTENLPVIRKLFGIPFGGKNPFTAEVWFVNKGLAFNIPWQMTSMSIHDVDYQTHMPLVAEGQYGLRISDAEKFLVKIVGPRQKYDQDDMTEQFNGEINSTVKSALLQFMISNHVGFKSVSAYLGQMSSYLCEQMRPFWSDLGVELTRFYVNSVDIDDSTPEGRKIKEAISMQSTMSITGHTWQQEQMFNTANNAMNNMGGIGNGGNGGLLGGLLAINMMRSMGGGNGNGNSIGSDMMAPQFNQPTFSPSNGANMPNGGMNAGMQHPGNNAKQVFCSNCSKKFSSEMSFCPNCGKKYNPCPQCGSDNDDNARRCVNCGASLMAGSGAALCPNCRQPIAQGASFCGNCGYKLVTSDKCSRCGHDIPPGIKFCPNCGNRR